MDLFGFKNKSTHRLVCAVRYTWRRFGHVGFADGTCLLVPGILGMTVRYTCGAGVLSLLDGRMR